MRGRFGPLRGTSKRTQSSVLDVIFSHHSKSICLMTQDFFSRAGTARGCAHSQFQLIQLVLSGSCRGPHFDAMSWSSVAAMQRSNQNMSKAHVSGNSFQSQQQIQDRNCDVVESCRESSVALLWKSGARVTKWPIRTYNGAGRSLCAIISLTALDPPPPPNPVRWFRAPPPPRRGFRFWGLHRCHHMVNRLSRLIITDPEGWPSGLRHRS